MADLQSYYAQVFKDSLLSQDPNLIYSLIQGQDNYFLQQAVALSMALVANEVNLLNDNIFPSSANSTFLDKHLSQLNLPPRSGPTSSIGEILVSVTGTVKENGRIPAGTLLTELTTGTVYITSLTKSFVVGDTFPKGFNLSVISQNVGPDTIIPVGSTLTFSAPVTIKGLSTITTGTVTLITSGENGQTDFDISYIITQNARLPKGSGSAGDYYTWALQSTPLITFVIVLSEGILSSLNSFFYVCVFSGSNDPNVNVTKPYPISRATPSAYLTICQNYLETKRGIQDNPTLITAGTYRIDNRDTVNPLAPKISLNITLSTGLQSDTPITGTNGVTQSVDNWIREEFRFCILSAPYQGEIADNTTQRYIKNDTIVSLMKSLLGNDSLNTGSLASIIDFISFTYTDKNNKDPILNIPVPPIINNNITVLLESNNLLYVVYDIDTASQNSTLQINYSTPPQSYYKSTLKWN